MIWCGNVAKSIAWEVYYVTANRPETAETCPEQQKSLEKFFKGKSGFLKHFEENGQTDGQREFVAPPQSNFWGPQSWRCVELS